MSLRGRFLVALLALLAAGLVLANVATYAALRSYLDRQVNDQLQQAATQVSGSLVDYGDDHDGGPGRGGHERDPRGDGSPDTRSLQPGTFVQVRDASNDVTYQSTSGGSGEWTQPDVPTELPASGSSFTVDATSSSGPAFRLLVSKTSDGHTIVTGVPLSGMTETLAGLIAIEAVVMVVVMLLAGVTAHRIARVGLRPLDEISATAADIAAGDLSKRVARDDDRTEIGQLGHSLNEMLGQIEQAFAEREASEARVRRFAADASHELRTPLAAVQAYAELFDRGGATHPEDLPRLMENIRKESARMAVLLDDLLLLTRLDQGRPLEREPVDLGAVAADAVEAARAVDPERPIVLDVEGSVEVLGDRLRLRQVMDNLLGNVRVHTPSGTPVEVVVADAGAEATLEVRDHGPGLTETQQRDVFERFYRIDPSRSRADGGSGLGLSIVAAIAEAHEGHASAHPTPGGGATFAVELPSLVGSSS